MGIGLPFSGENVVDDHTKGECLLLKMLPKPLIERAQASPHLMDYLHMIPIATCGVPEFHPEITRKLGEIAHPNIIYPVDEHVFVHIYPDVEDPRNYYITIEPPVGLNIDELLKEVERRLLDYVDILAEAETEEEKAKALALAVEMSCDVKGAAKGGNGQKQPKQKLALFSHTTGREGKVPVTPRELETLKYVVLRDKIGMGALDPLIKDSNIEDISCSGLGPVFVEHKVFKGLKSSIVFTAHEELDDFVLRLSENIKRPVTFKHPIVDAALPDGSSINIVYGGEV